MPVLPKNYFQSFNHMKKIVQFSTQQTSRELFIFALTDDGKMYQKSFFPMNTRWEEIESISDDCSCPMGFEPSENKPHFWRCNLYVKTLPDQRVDQHKDSSGNLEDVPF